MNERHTLPHDPNQPVFIERIEQVGDVRIVRLRGRIDQNTVEAGYEYILKLRRGEAIDTHLLLDCANVEHVDFSAVALLIVRMQDYLAAGRSVAILHANTKIRTHLELAEIEPRVHVFDTEAEALSVLTDAGSKSRSS